MSYVYTYAGTKDDQKGSSQLLLFVTIPVTTVFLLLLACIVTVTAVFIWKSWKNRAMVKLLQAQVMQLSTIYEEVDSKPQPINIMEDNVAYKQ